MAIMHKAEKCSLIIDSLLKQDYGTISILHDCSISPIRVPTILRVEHYRMLPWNTQVQASFCWGNVYWNHCSLKCYYIWTPIQHIVPA